MRPATTSAPDFGTCCHGGWGDSRRQSNEERLPGVEIIMVALGTFRGGSLLVFLGILVAKSATKVPYHTAVLVLNLVGTLIRPYHGIRIQLEIQQPYYSCVYKLY